MIIPGINTHIKKDSGQSMGSQSSCSLGKSAAQGLVRDQTTVGYKVVSP